MCSMVFRYLQSRWEARIKAKWNIYPKGQCIHDALRTQRMSLRLYTNLSCHSQEQGKRKGIRGRRRSMCKDSGTNHGYSRDCEQGNIASVGNVNGRQAVGLQGELLGQINGKILKIHQIHVWFKYFPPVCKKEPLQKCDWGIKQDQVGIFKIVLWLETSGKECENGP